MKNKKPTPKRKKRERTAKITVYITERAKQIYDAGIDNAYLCAQLIGEQVDEEILSREAEWTGNSDKSA